MENPSLQQAEPRSEIEKPGSPLWEEIGFVFRQTPELAHIGTKEQYLEYLKTIFPDSLIRYPVFHETKGSWFKTESFSKEKMGETDEGYYGKGFYFSSQPGLGAYGDHLFLSMLDVRNPKYHVGTHTVGKHILLGLTKEESREIAVAWLVDQIEQFEKDLQSLEGGHIQKHRDIPPGVDFETYWEQKRIERIKNTSRLIQEYKEQLFGIDSLIDNYYAHDCFATSDNLDHYEEVMVRNPDQIHILGSGSDVERFKKFVSKI